jgi:rod shape-determining protein MreC
MLIILILLSLAGIALDQNEDLQPIEDLALRFVVPIQGKLTSLANNLSDLTQATQDLKELNRRNEELQSLADRLMIENVRLKEIESENEALRRLLGFTQANPTHSYKAAEVKGRVIGRDPSNFLSYLTIDSGSQQGIERGMPVVTERGLVGRITEVGSNWAKVMLIIDPSSSVNALIQTSRATGVVEGQVGGSLLMKYIPQEETVNVNDIVLTSGLGGNFPKKLIIGQVTAVHQRDIEMFQQADIRPTVDFNNLEIVLVITNFQPIGFEEMGP